MNICSIHDCHNPRYARQWCSKHYSRYLKSGDPLFSKREVRQKEIASFFSTLLAWEDSSECVTTWPFGTSGPERRPSMVFRGNPGLVARFICEEMNGPPIGLANHAAHRCGNGMCINRHHVYWATPKENIHDKFIHGTVQRGEESPHHKLTEQEAREILALKGKLSSYKVALQYSVESRQIRRIWDRTRWKHLTDYP